MTLRQILLSFLFAVLLLSEMFGWRLGLGQGLSVKNAFLYALLLPVLFDLAVARRTAVGAGLAIHAGFWALTVLALISWSLTDVDTRMPMYSAEDRLIAIKSSLLDLYLFFLVYYHGAQNVKQAVTLAKALLILVMLANIVTVLDVYDIPDLGVIQQMENQSVANEGRLKGPIGEPNQYAAFLLMFMPAYFALAFAGSGGLLGRAVYAIGAGMAFISLVLTGSRGGILGLVLGLCWGAWLLRDRLAFRRLLRIAAVMLPFAVAVVALVAMKYGELLVGRLDATFGAGNAVTASAGRLWIWETGLEVMARQPESYVTGMGWHSFAPHVGIVPHNTYLSYFFSLGAVGLACYLVILYRVIRLAKEGFIAATGDAQALMAGFVIGFVCVILAVFFVDLFSPWYFVWAYVGVAARLSVLAVQQAGTNQTRNTRSVASPRYASLLR